MALNIIDIDRNEFALRRAKLIKNLPPQSLIIIYGNKFHIRSNDVQFPFRQNSNFHYLTGFDEPDAIMLLHNFNKKPYFLLFSKAKNPQYELWHGKLIGQTLAKKLYQPDEALPLTDFKTIANKFLNQSRHIYLPAEELGTIQKQLQLNLNIANINNINPHIYNLRLIKSPKELTIMRTAAAISIKAHTNLMRICRYKNYEYELAAEFSYICNQHNCNLAYPIIAASGANACTLHYQINTAKLGSNNLFLIDAGAEYKNYASDITRTYPINGKFTTAQAALYQLVLESQLAGIQAIRPNNTWDKIQAAVVHTLVTGLVKLEILKGKVKDLIKSEAYKEFYMHGSGHWLGLDVHDPSPYKVNDKWRKLQPNMVMTIEPGLYISPNNRKVEKIWRGIGIRIEDNVIVTKTGSEIFTHKLPKTIHAVEQLLNGSS